MKVVAYRVVQPAASISDKALYLRLAKCFRSQMRRRRAFHPAAGAQKRPSRSFGRPVLAVYPFSAFRQENQDPFKILQRVR